MVDMTCTQRIIILCSILWLNTKLLFFLCKSYLRIKLKRKPLNSQRILIWFRYILPPDWWQLIQNADIGRIDSEADTEWASCITHSTKSAKSLKKLTAIRGARTNSCSPKICLALRIDISGLSHAMQKKYIAVVYNSQYWLLKTFQIQIATAMLPCKWNTPYCKLMLIAYWSFFRIVLHIKIFCFSCLRKNSLWIQKVKVFKPMLCNFWP